MFVFSTCQLGKLYVAIEFLMMQLTVSMASSGWVEKGSGELFVEFLARKCALGEDVSKSKVQATSKELGTKSIDMFKTEVRFLYYWCIFLQY